MKHSITILTITVFFALQCFAQKKQKIIYDFPQQMAPAIQAEYAKLCDKGKILYDMNCAKCHNTRVKGKEVIPDFTQEKLIGYELRVSNQQHEADMPDTKVTAEELGLITTFLTYKKRNDTTRR
ncbi:c-type cytochrome [Chitinophagaceae bacterium MMS25-I14]